MRCRACNRPLTDFEDSRRYISSGTPLDLCTRCYLPVADQIEVEYNWSAYDPKVDNLDTREGPGPHSESSDTYVDPEDDGGD